MKNIKKIAIIADIHANKYALDEFLKFIDKNKVDMILNLGDFLQIGPNPKEVSDIILNNEKFVNILGNNETSLLDINYEILSSENQHRIWTKEQVKENLNKIKEIPQVRVITINGLRFLMIHSRKNDIEDTPLIYTKRLEDFENDYKDYHADVVLFGHTHKKLYIENNYKLYLNPGSLGCSFNNSVDFVILEIEEQGVINNCYFNSLKYDYSNLIKDYEKKNVPDKEFLIKTFFKK